MLAERLGIAFQLTNILRDVKADSEMGRVYLPAGRSRAFRLFAPPSSPRRAYSAPRARTHATFKPTAPGAFTQKALNSSRLVDRDSRAALWALARIYSSLLGAHRSPRF